MYKKYAVSVICAGALMFAGFVGAVTNVDGTVKTEVKVEGSGASSGKLDATNRGLDAKIDSKIEVESEIEDKDDGDGDSERLLPTLNKKTGAKVLVRGWDTAKKEAIQAKIDTEIENNPEIKTAEVSETSVDIKYSAPAKFLGIFPGHFNLHISADAQARVKVKFPWYRFLLKTKFADSAELMNGVFQNNQTDLEFLITKAPEERQVEIFTRISNMLKAMHDMAIPIIGNIKA
ncbi:MAG: hypothetical protein EXS52_00970 [Candidatus Staskawiczbacteria bacterium]|nr:hypothetical protein [Candidatus Staskawiczbacteria bacterium]